MGKITKLVLASLIILVLVGLVATQLQLSSWLGSRITRLEDMNRQTIGQIEALDQKQKSLELARAELISRLRQQVAFSGNAGTGGQGPAAISSGATSLDKDMAALDSQMQALSAQQLAADSQLSARIAAQATATKTNTPKAASGTSTSQGTAASASTATTSASASTSASTNTAPATPAVQVVKPVVTTTPKVTQAS